MERIRPHVKVGSSHDAAVHPTLVSRAQRSASRRRVRCRPGTVTDRVLGGPGSAMHHSLTLALHRIRDTQASDAFGALFTFQTAQIFSFPRRIFAPGVCNFASLTPNRGVGGAPRDVRVQRHPCGTP
jgi:hypothetical protein